MGGVAQRATMYYNRKISDSFSKLIENGGELRWLFDYVKHREDLDFLIGKNNSTEWISVYRGLTRILRIKPESGFREIYIDAAHKYKGIASDLGVDIYGVKPVAFNFQENLEKLIKQTESDSKLNRYYTNKKEGYYQNVLSRKYGICGRSQDAFVIIDKEAVIGYANQKQKDSLLGQIQRKYKELQKDISQRYGYSIEKKAIGNELDFVALDKEGNILLIEYKHGTNTAGIYLSPLQIGMYYDLFNSLQREDLQCAVNEMIDQKQKIGLVNPYWQRPADVKDVIPVLIISDYNYKSSAKLQFDEILQFLRTQIRTQNRKVFLSDLQIYNFTLGSGLSQW